MAGPLEILKEIKRIYADEPLEKFRGISEVVVPQTPEDVGLELALGPFGRIPKLGGLAMAGLGYSPEAEGAFVGQLAKLAPNLLQRAKQMLSEGATSREVWDATKWFTGPEGKLRYEIPDENLGFRMDFENLPRSKRYIQEQIDMPLMGVLSHPELQRAYPQLARDYRADVTKMSDWLPGIAERGAQHPPQRGTKMFPWEPGKVEVFAKTPETGLDIAAHELQHAIQGYEGFPTGGTTELFFEKGPLEAALQRALKNPDFRDPVTGDFDFAIEKRLASPYAVESPLEGYRRLAGEAEARAVEKRRRYTPEERMGIFPLEDYDVPIEDLIIRYR